MRSTLFAGGTAFLWFAASHSALASALPPRTSCDVASIQSLGALQNALSRRAVEAVALAAIPSGQSDARLKELVAGQADVSLGAGDVGRPMGKGVNGIRALATAMNADAFRFFGWDYMPTPISDACGEYKVTVEFTDSRLSIVFPIEFAFQNGQIISAQGWTRSFQAGTIKTINP